MNLSFTIILLIISIFQSTSAQPRKLNNHDDQHLQQQKPVSKNADIFHNLPRHHNSVISLQNVSTQPRVIRDNHDKHIHQCKQTSVNMNRAHQHKETFVYDKYTHQRRRTYERIKKSADEPEYDFGPCSRMEQPVNTPVDTDLNSIIKDLNLLLDSNYIPTSHLENTKLYMFEDNYKEFLRTKHNKMLIDYCSQTLQPIPLRLVNKSNHDYRQDEDYYLRVFLNTFFISNNNSDFWNIIKHLAESPLRYCNNDYYLETIYSFNTKNNAEFVPFDNFDQQQQSSKLFENQFLKNHYINYRRLDEKCNFLYEVTARFVCDPINARFEDMHNIDAQIILNEALASLNCHNKNVAKTKIVIERFIDDAVCCKPIMVYSNKISAKNNILHYLLSEAAANYIEMLKVKSLLPVEIFNAQS